ncbi:hypothetical protein R8O77_001089 [Klebsiella michiganensis]|uniref:hypothetical protein n=1 Tax=Klebsiella michiganensis TaxID=1134687 RepID=UPI0015F248B7|nr:hypothetical protein [Klebsiella michiganensis]ELT9725501.1 hypothetical protein [Klebsiella michiganensis]
MWNGKRAIKLGIVFLIGASICYHFYDEFIYIFVVIMLVLGFKCEVEQDER